MERGHRLTRGADFSRVRKQGRSWAHPLMILSVDRNDLGCTRFGFVVSRRIGTAVTRNRIKRRLREVVRHHLDQVPAGWDMVIVARAPIVEARFADIEAVFTQLLRRAGIWQRQAAVE